jgi:hypothetical protein
MPFLVPAIPAIASLIGGSVASKFVGGPSGQQKDANTSVQQLASSLGSRGLSFLDQAKSATSGPQNYFQSILSGNRGQATQSLAPDIEQIGTGFNQAERTTTELAPRSGGRATLFNELPFQKSGTINNLFSTARTSAADALSKLGLGFGGLGTSAVAGGLNGFNGLQTALAGQRENQYNTGKDLGAGFYNIAKSVDWTKIFKGSGGGGG